MAHGPPSGIFARLTAQCQGPEVTITNPEIVWPRRCGEKSEMQVTFRNLSNTEASWSLAEVGANEIDIENPQKI